ncbi:hypothetical protein QN277_007500 [Acacia crassicarpa]|uniref:MADS-box domain-containing protein n=1 Tax=Acacia crassicarpa TaxID=499986 RepID=A0AAE1IUM8_9FABA|nr:hypothetical protein QN277_007500 [Acacia crassicarpa]
MDSTCSSSTKPTRKPGKGRRKIEIKKVEESSKRLVTFSKRKLGLFRKAAELSLLCESEIAAVVFSQQGKMFSSGYPNPDSVIQRYLSSDTFSSSSSDPAAGESSGVSSLRREYEEAMKVLDGEKKSLNAVAEATSGSGSEDGSWWNRSVSEMGLEEVQEFKERLQQLRHNLVAAAEEKMTTAAAEKMTASVVTLPPPTEEEESLFQSMLNDDLGMAKNDQTWDWGCDSWIDTTSWNESSCLVWNSDAGHSDINDKGF